MGTATRDEIIAIEQKAVDRAYDCYVERLAEMTGLSVASASASGERLGVGDGRGSLPTCPGHSRCLSPAQHLPRLYT